MLSAMQFKRFVWPHNPTTYTVSGSRRTAIHRIPYGGCTVEDLGADCRIMEGSGEFCGKDAYDTFRQLSEVFDEGTPGVLLHPLWHSMTAVFTQLKLLEEPGEDHLRYSFQFVQQKDYEPLTWEISEAVCAQDETLWSLAQRNGVAVSTLLALNPQLQSANALTAGRRVRLR